MSIEKDKQALSDITVFNKYARFIPEIGRRETFEEITDRNKAMHRRKFPELKAHIDEAYDLVKSRKLLPSMRSMQFGGRPIEMAENRIFNCAFSPCDHYKFFSELMFLLLGGTGMGYSVQSHHVNRLPSIKQPNVSGDRYQVQDSIVGWADAIKIVCKAFFFGKVLPSFDFRDIREKGADLITTGGKAPGPEPLAKCVELLIQLFQTRVGQKLRTIDAHDVSCIIADAVLAGGIRRAAMIVLFDKDDEDMITSKSGEWWVNHAYRARANNSAVLERGVKTDVLSKVKKFFTGKDTLKVSEKEFKTLMQRVQDSNCGEPGVYWTNNIDWGTNPCCEISLRENQMCNLTEINVSNVETQEDLNARVRGATIIGTLQAAYTDFHYLRPVWRKNCEEDALLGVSMTGIASAGILGLNLEEAAAIAIQTNIEVAALLGINASARITTVKPAGTTSLTLGCSSGIHAWHNDFYIRRMRAGKNEALAQYMSKVAPQLVEQDVMADHQVVLSFPQKAPEGAIVRTEPMINLLERVKKVSIEWVKAGHVYGDNTHNVSCTISVKDNEWVELRDWMWDNREFYNGISVLPYFGAEAYPQLPFSDCTEEEFNELLPFLNAIDITKVTELNGNAIDLQGELACSGGACEVM